MNVLKLIAEILGLKQNTRKKNPKPPEAKTIQFFIGGVKVNTITMPLGSKGQQLAAAGADANGNPAPLVQPAPNQDVLWTVSPTGIVALEQIPGSLLCNITPLASGICVVTCAGNSLTGGAAISGLISVSDQPPAATQIIITATPLA